METAENLTKLNLQAGSLSESGQQTKSKEVPASTLEAQDPETKVTTEAEQPAALEAKVRLRQFFSTFGLILPEDVNAPLILGEELRATVAKKQCDSEWEERLVVNLGSSAVTDGSLIPEPGSPYQVTALQFLVGVNNAARAADLMHFKPNLNVSFADDSRTSLDVALEYNSAEMVRVLVSHGAQVEKTSASLCSAFLTLYEQGNERYMRSKSLNQLGPVLKILVDWRIISSPKDIPFECPDYKEITETYLQIYQHLKNELTAAQLENQFLDIMVFEGHYLKYSLLIDMLVLYACRALNINTVLFELNKRKYDEMRRRSHEEGTHYDFSSLSHLVGLVLEFGMKHSCIDMPELGPTFDMDIFSLAERNFYMKELRQLYFKQHTVLFCGADHAQDLLEHSALDRKKNIERCVFPLFWTDWFQL